MAATQEGEKTAQKEKTSKQLLYAEKFAGTLLEQKLHVVGKKKTSLEKPCIPPPSSVLSQVKALLPKLQEANEKLKSQPQAEVDIEEISPDYDGPVIEMNLAMVPNLETSDSDSDSSSSSSGEEEEESDEDCDEKDGDSGDGPSVSDFLAPLNHQRGTKRKLIQEVLDEEVSDKEDESHQEENMD